jgi:hypothetical protein
MPENWTTAYLYHGLGTHDGLFGNAGAIPTCKNYSLHLSFTLMLVYESGTTHLITFEYGAFSVKYARDGEKYRFLI